MLMFSSKPVLGEFYLNTLWATGFKIFLFEYLQWLPA